MKLKENNAVLLLGTNLGDQLKMLSACKDAIQNNVGYILKVSPIYESEAWGYSSTNNFLNQVIIVETFLSPRGLLEKNQEIEKQLGRKAKLNTAYTDRPIDVDILFYSHKIVQESDLNIPHLEIKNRKFTLLPLNDLIPNYIHPVYKKSIKALLRDCNDNGKVWLSSI